MLRPKLLSETPLTAKFLSRINRFVIKCHLAGVGEVKAYMANPGRLGELLLPGAPLLIETVSDDSARKLRYAASAVFTGESFIGLNTHQANAVARYLLKNKLIPTLENANIEKEEISIGRNRFDFLMSENRQKFLMEVKSVTLSANKIAMFPDAITKRGTRHLNELAKSKESIIKPVVFFISQGLGNNLFMPDYHTDLVFSRTLLALKERLRIVPIEIKWDQNLELSDSVKLLDVPWSFLKTRMEDKGAYILVMEIPKACNIAIGSIGRVDVNPGYYLYAGSGMNGLSSRISRHLRKKKKLHWHVDFLRQVAGKVKAYPIRTPQYIEEELVLALEQVFSPVLHGFGASDSNLGTHLFYSPSDPFLTKSFQVLLSKFRFNGS